MSFANTTFHSEQIDKIGDVRRVMTDAAGCHLF